jgi:hypothetical protein
MGWELKLLIYLVHLEVECEKGTHSHEYRSFIGIIIHLKFVGRLT